MVRDDITFKLKSKEFKTFQKNRQKYEQEQNLRLERVQEKLVQKKKETVKDAPTKNMNGAKGGARGCTNAPTCEGKNDTETCDSAQVEPQARKRKTSPRFDKTGSGKRKKLNSSSTTEEREERKPAAEEPDIRRGTTGRVRGGRISVPARSKPHVNAYTEGGLPKKETKKRNTRNSLQKDYTSGATLKVATTSEPPRPAAKVHITNPNLKKNTKKSTPLVKTKSQEPKWKPVRSPPPRKTQNSITKNYELSSDAIKDFQASCFQEPETSSNSTHNPPYNLEEPTTMAHLRLLEDLKKLRRDELANSQERKKENKDVHTTFDSLLRKNCDTNFM